MISFLQKLSRSARNIQTRQITNTISLVMHHFTSHVDSSLCSHMMMQVLPWHHLILSECSFAAWLILYLLQVPGAARVRLLLMLTIQQYNITPKSLTFSLLPITNFTSNTFREQATKMMEQVPHFITQLHHFLMTSLHPQDPPFTSLLQYISPVPC